MIKNMYCAMVDDMKLSKERLEAIMSFSPKMKKRTVIPALVAVLTVMLTGAAGAASYGPIVSILNDIMIVESEQSEGTRLSAEKVEAMLKNAAIPGDYEISDVSTRELDAYTRIGVRCTGERGSISITAKVYKDERSLVTAYEIDEGTGPELFNAGGASFYIAKNTDEFSARGEYGGCEISIHGNITEDEMKEIIKSVVKCESTDNKRR
ncbi:MAG: DUF4367 domain-containing protein [Oscillospiraceae bacterium]|nr:DUF4367 domain-containing protein [Oscillospiraceae bacterium]